MKIQAILFMCNDFARAKFTLENFNKWNPNIPIKVINSGGDSPKPYLDHIKNIEFVDAPNLWHKKTACGKGSFGPQFANFFFDYGLSSKFTHTLLLETDVLTNGPLTQEPRYEISGVFNLGGDDQIYNFLSIEGPKLHTGCGGTIFSASYFAKIIESHNIKMFDVLFEKFPQYYYMDFVLTVIGRISGCSFGYWEEITNITPFYELEIDNLNITAKFCNPNFTKTLVHGYKV